MNECTLRAAGLNKSYGDNHVLRDLDVVLEPGKIYGLIGRNGAGKTTLLGCLTGQNTFQSGQVTCGGEKVWENRRALERICFSRELPETVMGSRNSQKIGHYLNAAMVFFTNWDQKYAEALLKEFHLDPKKKIYALSRGQRSMVTILIALASKAPVTILDEPVSGLDVVMRERFYQLLLEEFSRSERTFVVSTHIIEEAAAVFEEVLFLDRGQIIEHAPVDELVDQFRYVSGLAEEVDRACTGLTVLSTQDMGRRRTAAVRGGEKALAELSSYDVDVAPLNLQNVFVALCGQEHPQA